MRRRDFLLLAIPISDLESEIPRLMKETSVPGLSIAIIKDANLHWRRGFGVKDAATGQPTGNDTMFEAASMSKPVFAYAVLKLCEKGVLDLDAPLSRYTPDRFLPDDPRLNTITARHVLSHSSGLQNWRSTAEPLKIHFTPGERWLYSGEGYFYLQSVVTRLAGHRNPAPCGRYESDLEVCATDIDAYMRANLLAPFGMASSAYVWNAACERHMARPHDLHGQPLDNKKSTAADAARYASSGALLTTPSDYARFLIEVVAPKRPDAARLNKTSLQQMLRPHIKASDEFSISWALGWKTAHLNGSTVISHGGDNLGFHSVAAASPQHRTGFVVMTNGDNGPALLKKLAPLLDRLL